MSFRIGETDVNAGSLSRQKNRLAVLADSRGAQWHSDVTKLTRAGYNHRVPGDCLAGRRTIMVGNFGVSGERSDQIISRLDLALASMCGTLDLQMGVNDVAQATAGYTAVGGPMAGQAITLTNVLTMMLANVETIIIAAVKANVPNIILTLDPGAGNMNATQVGIILRYNQGLREFAERYPGVVTFDLPAYVWSPTTSTSAAFAYITGAHLSESGAFVHEGAIGAQLAGVGYAQLLTSIMPALPRNFRSNAEQNSALNKTGLLLNPLFTTVSGGTVGTGITGPVPASWVASRGSGGSGSATATITTQANPEGFGNELVVACTFAGAADVIYIGQDVPNADWDIGTIVEGGSQIVVDSGSVNLAGVEEFLQNAWNSGSISNYAMDNYQRGEAGLQTGYKYDLLTQPLLCAQPVPNATKSWLTKRIQIKGAGAGSATVRIRTSQIRKRFSL